jgi:crotonobetainyl-CoA:carnitine CoA-transferase CaiB-like acyl-CoA transferase
MAAVRREDARTGLPMNAAKPARTEGPLAGIRVLDLTSVIFGAYATQQLGDLGADVIKIESPDGDTTRYTGPCRNEGMASLFMGVNRNKRSVVLDLKQAAARDVLLRMADAADAFVHNIRPQKLEKIGVGADALLARNPRLIYAGLHGWREGGPYSGRPAYDDIMQGLTGIASLMDTMTGEPRYAPTILADKTCGVMAAQAIVAALFHRERTGKGQFVEVPMFETMVSYVMVEHLHGRTFDPPVGSAGYSRMLAPWRRPYRTADGHVCTLIYTDAQWRRFWNALQQPEMMNDPRFMDIAARSRNISDVYRIAESQFAGKTTQQWLTLFEELEIPAGPLNSLDDVLDDEHLKAVGFFKHFKHPTEGEIVMPDVPFRFTDSPAGIGRLPPRLGEHGRDVLAEFGVKADEIDTLLAAGGLVIPDMPSKPKQRVS